MSESQKNFCFMCNERLDRARQKLLVQGGKSASTSGGSSLSTGDLYWLELIGRGAPRLSLLKTSPRERVYVTPRMRTSTPPPLDTPTRADLVLASKMTSYPLTVHKPFLVSSAHWSSATHTQQWPWRSGLNCAVVGNPHHVGCWKKTQRHRAWKYA